MRDGPGTRGDLGEAGGAGQAPDAEGDGSAKGMSAVPKVYGDACHLEYHMEPVWNPYGTYNSQDRIVNAGNGSSVTLIEVAPEAMWSTPFWKLLGRVIPPSCQRQC